jgi:CheY-like chemotaxis protein
MVVVSVEDDGIGIPEDRLESIFDMFSQIESSLDRAHGGLGLGLTLAKRLVEMHGGSIEARSAGPGQGSEFIVRLPIVLEAPRVSAPAEPIAASERRFILVVDDNKDSARSLAALLRLAGHETLVAHDGLEALEVVERSRVDVVLLDIGLPKLDGYATCRRLRQRQNGASLAIVALTGWGQEEDRRLAREAGFDNHMIKPVDLAALAALLASFPSEQPG